MTLTCLINFRLESWLSDPMTFGGRDDQPRPQRHVFLLSGELDRCLPFII